MIETQQPSQGQQLTASGHGHSSLLTGRDNSSQLVVTPLCSQPGTATHSQWSLLIPLSSQLRRADLWTGRFNYQLSHTPRSHQAFLQFLGIPFAIYETELSFVLAVSCPSVRVNEAFSPFLRVQFPFTEGLYFFFLLARPFLRGLQFLRRM